jgi:hypothetical protein
MFRPRRVGGGRARGQRGRAGGGAPRRAPASRVLRRKCDNYPWETPVRAAGTRYGPDRLGLCGAIRGAPRTGWAAGATSGRGTADRRPTTRIRMDEHGGPAPRLPPGACRRKPCADSDSCGSRPRHSRVPGRDRWSPVGWTARAATSPDCAERGGRDDPGWNRVEAETAAGRAGANRIRMHRGGIGPLSTATTRNPSGLYTDPHLPLSGRGEIW